MIKALEQAAFGAPLVLCYHAISADWPALLATSPKRLEAQLETLVSRGFEGVTFGEAMAGEMDARKLAVTFDDACTSVFERALPILRRLGLPGTVYAPTAFVGRDGPMQWPGIERWRGTPYEPELACMSWDQLEALRNEGWEVGSHTRVHPRLTELGDDALAEELSASRQVLAERVGGGQTLAFPYGDYDGRVMEAARTAGYDAAAGLRPGRRTPWCWPRVGIYPRDSEWRFRLKAARPTRRIRESPIGKALQRVRQVHA